MIKRILEVIPIEKMAGREISTASYNRDSKVGDQLVDLYSTHAVRYEILETDKIKPTKPGVYAVRKAGYELILRPKEILLEPNVGRVDAVDISDKIKIFFSKSDFFISRNLFPKRGLLLHGPAGCGKTHSINQCVTDLIGPNGIAIYIAMDEVRISDVVNMFEKLELDESVDKLFLIIEDLGGGEMTDKAKVFFASQSDLLALLDGNSLPWKKLPTVILSTTNYPKNFLENILDRPGRFDEVIEFKLPSGEAALAYAQSLDVPLSDFDIRSILKGNIGLAHVKDAIVQKAVYDLAIHNTLEAMRARSEKVRKDLDTKLDL